MCRVLHAPPRFRPSDASAVDILGPRSRTRPSSPAPARSSSTSASVPVMPTSTGRIDSPGRDGRPRGPRSPPTAASCARPHTVGR